MHRDCGSELCYKLSALSNVGAAPMGITLIGKEKLHRGHLGLCLTSETVRDANTSNIVTLNHVTRSLFLLLLVRSKDCSESRLGIVTPFLFSPPLISPSLPRQDFAIKLNLFTDSTSTLLTLLTFHQSLLPTPSLQEHQIATLRSIFRAQT